jgi:hypothetical protein
MFENKEIAYDVTVSNTICKLLKLPSNFPNAKIVRSHHFIEPNSARLHDFVGILSYVDVKLLHPSGRYCIENKLNPGVYIYIHWF